MPDTAVESFAGVATRFHSDLSSTAKGRYRPVDIEISSPYDTFGEARGEDKARLFEVYGYTFLAVKPRG